MALNGVSSWRRACARWIVGAAVCAALASTAAAADEPLAARLREQIITLNVPERPSISLETTLYLPPGDGPFPLVIINHGKAPGDPRFQERSRFLVPSREFVSRGYAVAIPMRRGFADSSGRYIPSGCDISGNGVAEADDIHLALLALSRRPDIDARRVVIVGQSHGGLSSVAFGARNLGPVVGVVNFSGGLRVESCRTWQRELEHAMGEYGAVSRVPSLWFYGDNDSYFSVDTWQAMYKAYTDAGGKARLVAFGKFGDDSHGLFASNAGVVIWVPPVREFFQQLGLNFDVRYRIVLADHETAPPARSNFAELAGLDKLPFVRDDGRQAYASWLDAAPPRAFAIGDGGAWGRASGNAKAMRMALDNCNAHKPTEPCRLYAVDDAVVWTPNQ